MVDPWLGCRSAIVAAIVWSAARRSDAQLSAVRQEMQNSLATQGQSVNAQINHLMQSVTTQLGQVRQELQTGVASSGKLASDAQIAMAQQLQSSNETIRKISMQMAEVQQAGQEMSKSAQTLQNVLGGAKTRGILGEVVLERLLQDALPRSAYETQYRFDSTGAIVDAIVRSGDRILSVDSKFPLDAYRRLMDAGETARREFSLAVRKHADSIAEKYILPDEHTFDYALMFVPSEGVYYELLMTRRFKIRPDRRILPRETRVPRFAKHFLRLPQRGCHQPARAENRGERAAFARGHGRD